MLQEQLRLVTDTKWNLTQAQVSLVVGDDGLVDAGIRHHTTDKDRLETHDLAHYDEVMDMTEEQLAMVQSQRF